MINLNLYWGRGQSILANVPIAHLDEVKRLLKILEPNEKFRVRYRGPRNTMLDYSRGRDNRASTCLKANAVKFSGYRDY